MIPPGFGTRLLSLRKGKNLNQYEVAQEVGISRDT